MLICTSLLHFWKAAYPLLMEGLGTKSENISRLKPSP
jgi:hypothetical protein